ncbi:hypothetical protein GCM10009616_35920 [Microlunatus lacustris]
MPISEEVVVRCEHTDCGQLFTVSSAMSNNPREAARDMLTERGWTSITVTRADGIIDEVLHCPPHSRDFAAYLGGPAQTIQV